MGVPIDPGFVGRSVARALRVVDLPVRCLVRDRGKAATLRAWGCEIVRGDMADSGSLRAAVRGCDAIYVLVNGKIGEAGTYDELMESKAEFFRLASASAG